MIKIKPKLSLFNQYLKQYWFAPQDVLVRSAEASIFHTLKYKHPILEIGIGDGGISRYLFPKNITIDMGTDINPIGFAKVKETHKYKKILEADAQNLPFKKASFSVVVSNSTFEHIDHDAAALKEVGRVLKRGGLFYLTVPNVYLLKVIPVDKQAAYNSRLQHKHYHTVGHWEKMFSKNHLELVDSLAYLPEDTTKLMFASFCWSTRVIAGREVWSWLADSKLRKFIPEDLVRFWLAKLLLPKFLESFTTSNGEGGMLLLIGKKV